MTCQCNGPQQVLCFIAASIFTQYAKHFPVLQPYIADAWQAVDQFTTELECAEANPKMKAVLTALHIYASEQGNVKILTKLLDERADTPLPLCSLLTGS